MVYDCPRNITEYYFLFIRALSVSNTVPQIVKMDYTMQQKGRRWISYQRKGNFFYNN